MSDRRTCARQWAWGRAWSRAGAIADVLGRGTPRRFLAYTTRIALLLAGSLMIACAVAVMLWNDFGPGPLDVFIGAVRTTAGIPLTFAVWLTVGSLVVIAWALGRRPGPGTLVTPFLVGPVMQVALERLQAFSPPHDLVVHVAVHGLAIATIGLGAGALIVSGLGAGSGELLAAAASDRTGRPEPRLRMGFELAFLVLGVALGGPIGPGTLMVAVLIGPSVATGYRVVDAWAVASRRRVAIVVP
ncbi:MAG: hypothetical protein ABIO83_00355 [Ilumatobacteraceae bacterium]